MSKVGILTFHKVDNYGAVLQTYALQEAISQEGAPSCVVDYYPDFMKESNALYSRYSIKSFFKSLIYIGKKANKRHVFDVFRHKYLRICGEKLSEKDIINKCKDIDVFALGSDQIWNPNITKGIDKVYYGRICEKQQRAFSYAASIGVGTLKPETKLCMRELALNLMGISVREQDAADLLGINESKVVCDPVLLHDKDFWIDTFNIAIGNDQPYILLYALTGYKETYDMARLLAEKSGLKVIEIRNAPHTKIEIVGETILFSASPEKFVELIANAEYVVTDSFHGTAFSTIFEKSMFVIPNKEKGSRMINLMNRLGLSNRIIDCSEKISCSTIESKIDFEYMRAQMKNFRNESRQFLQDMLSLRS